MIDHDAASAAVAAVLLDCEGEPPAPVADEHEPTFAQLLAECQGGYQRLTYSFSDISILWAS